MKIVALLPMKANSERVPGKNFKKLGGKPLFKWMLDTLHHMDEIDTIVVNTDARATLDEHNIRSYPKVVVRDRKPELCGDLVSMNLVLSDDIENVPADVYLMTHTTNPFLSSTSVRRAIRAYKHRGSDKDSLFTVNRWQTRFYRENGDPINHDPENLLRTQDLEPWYEENSCLYIFSAESFRSSQARIGKGPVLFETPPLESIDIDGQNEWDIASALAPQYSETSAKIMELS